MSLISGGNRRVLSEATGAFCRRQRERSAGANGSVLPEAIGSFLRRIQERFSGGSRGLQAPESSLPQTGFSPGPHRDNSPHPPHPQRI